MSEEQKSIISLKNLVGNTDNQIFLIVGPPGSGKEEFAIQFMIDGFVEKNNGVFLTTDSFPSEIIAKMKQLGTDPTSFISGKQLQFIDAFSYRTGESVDKNGLAVDNIRNLTGLSVIIKQLIDTNEKLRLVINTVSTISIYNSGVSLLDFTQAQAARLKQKNHSGLIIAHEGMMEEKVIQGMKAFVDGVIEFQKTETVKGTLKNELRVTYAPKIRRSGWLDLHK
ncbi:MAG: RAD55 family ATPase [Candidatus Heimdallarchaeota archaeon]